VLVPAAAGPALKPRESSSGAARPAAEEDVATQSAKAPESEGNLLVVATTDAVVKISNLDCVLNIPRQREKERERGRERNL
jgi:hypothetical protein